MFVPAGNTRGKLFTQTCKSQGARAAKTAAESATAVYIIDTKNAIKKGYEELCIYKVLRKGEPGEFGNQQLGRSIRNILGQA